MASSRSVKPSPLEFSTTWRHELETMNLADLAPDVLETAIDIAEASGLLAVADAALERTGDAGIAASIIGDVADALVAWDEIGLGPLGELIEERDDAAVAWLAGVVISLAMNPVRRAQRRARRQARRESRIERREERKARRGD